MAPDLTTTVLLRLEALEQQMAIMRAVVGSDRPGLDDTEQRTVLARLRALEETAAAGRRE